MGARQQRLDGSTEEPVEEQEAHSEETMKMKNSPNLGPLEAAKTIARRITK